MSDLNGTPGAPAARFDSNSVVDWSNLGAALLVQGRIGEAIGCVDRSLELDPRLAAAWANKSGMLGKWPNAIRSYRQFLEQDPARYYAEQVEYTRKRLQELAK